MDNLRNRDGGPIGDGQEYAEIFFDVSSCVRSRLKAIEEWLELHLRVSYVGNVGLTPNVYFCMRMCLCYRINSLHNQVYLFLYPLPPNAFVLNLNLIPPNLTFCCFLSETRFHCIVFGVRIWFIYLVSFVTSIVPVSALRMSWLTKSSRSKTTVMMPPFHDMTFDFDD